MGVSRNTEAQHESKKMRDDDQLLLDFEEAHARNDARKAALVRETFSISMTRYYQRLFILIDDPETLLTHAQLVHRVQRSRARRSQARANRTVGF